MHIGRPRAPQDERPATLEQFLQSMAAVAPHAQLPTMLQHDEQLALDRAAVDLVRPSGHAADAPGMVQGAMLTQREAALSGPHSARIPGRKIAAARKLQTYAGTANTGLPGRLDKPADARHVEAAADAAPVANPAVWTARQGELALAGTASVDDGSAALASTTATLDDLGAMHMAALAAVQAGASDGHAQPNIARAADPLDSTRRMREIPRKSSEAALAALAARRDVTRNIAAHKSAQQALVMLRQRAATQGGTTALFKALDMDADGVLSAQDVQSGLAQTYNVHIEPMQARLLLDMLANESVKAMGSSSPVSPAVRSIHLERALSRQDAMRDRQTELRPAPPQVAAELHGHAQERLGKSDALELGRLVATLHTREPGIASALPITQRAAMQLAKRLDYDLDGAVAVRDMAQHLHAARRGGVAGKITQDDAQSTEIARQSIRRVAEAPAAGPLPAPESAADEAILALVQAMDRNGDGYISSADLRAFSAAVHDGLHEVHVARQHGARLADEPTGPAPTSGPAAAARRAVQELQPPVSPERTALHASLADTLAVKLKPVGGTGIAALSEDQVAHGDAAASRVVPPLDFSRLPQKGGQPRLSMTAGGERAVLASQVSAWPAAFAGSPRDWQDVAAAHSGRAQGAALLAAGADYSATERQQARRLFHSYAAGAPPKSQRHIPGSTRTVTAMDAALADRTAAGPPSRRGRRIREQQYSTAHVVQPAQGTPAAASGGEQWCSVARTVAAQGLSPRANPALAAQATAASQQAAWQVGVKGGAALELASARRVLREPTAPAPRASEREDVLSFTGRSAQPRPGRAGGDKQALDARVLAAYQAEQQHKAEALSARLDAKAAARAAYEQGAHQHGGKLDLSTSQAAASSGIRTGKRTFPGKANASTFGAVLPMLLTR